MNGPKAGNEGLPYKKASEVCGGPVDGDYEAGLGEGKGVDGKSSVTPPKGK